jgi:hypothetical protein
MKMVNCIVAAVSLTFFTVVAAMGLEPMTAAILITHGPMKNEHDLRGNTQPGQAGTN